MLYINKFELPFDQNLSEYFKLIPNTQDFGEGIETGHFSQSNFNIEPNLQLSLKTVFSLTKQTNVKEIMLECSCTATNINGKNSGEDLAKDAHEKASEAFRKIVQSKLKEIIK